MAKGANRIMSSGCIRIDRDRTAFTVSLTDPEISKANQASKGDWQDPCVEYSFESKEQVLAFLDKAMDIALPEDAYSSAFDKLAKDVQDE